MKLLTLLLLATTLHANTLTMVSCTYTGYDPNFGASFYTGIYRGLNGAVYTYRFNSADYNYCPWSM